MKILITGGTGFIGKAAKTAFEKEGHEVIALRRSTESSAQLVGVDAIINLAGAPIAGKRWNAQVKQEIHDSRVKSTAALVSAVSAMSREERPKVMISASAVGFYGDRGNELLTEHSARGTGFLADVTRDWELKASEMQVHGVRVVIARHGIVLGKDGGALEKMPPIVLGTGDQWISWVHLKDVLGFYRFALENGAVRGTYNLTAPEPVTQAEFARTLAKSKGYPFPLWSPAFVVKAALGEMSVSLFDSERAVPEHAQNAGFQFSFKKLEPALADLRN